MQLDIKAPLITDMVHLHGKWHPNKAALIDECRTASWSDFDQATNRVANGLAAMGVKKGDSVAVLMSNNIEMAEIMLGVMKAGAVIVPLNVAVNEEGLAMMLKDSTSRAIFFTSEHYVRMTPFLENLEDLLPGGIINHGQCDGEYTNYIEWRDAQDNHNPEIEIEDDDPCNIIYSSGTTGEPKGIKHIHRPRIDAMFELALAHRYHCGVIAICPIGLYSNIAWASLFCSIVVGGTCVIQEKFDPALWVEAVKKYQVSHTMMVPIMCQKILEAPNFSPVAVASLQAIISAGSPLFEGLKKQVTEQFNCAVIELYGLTEGFMTTLQPEDAKGRLGSVGKPVPGNDYILLDDDNEELPWGEEGEIAARSVHWMLEYHNKPEATRDTLYIDAKGLQWLRSGDIGRVDEDGFLYIVDRKKDMILSGGQNIYPVDIEAVMMKHPLVSEVAVIGVPHDKWGETPLALVVARGSTNTNPTQEILEWTNVKVGKRQRISAVELRQEMPRNPNGKILKRELRKSYWP